MNRINLLIALFCAGISFCFAEEQKRSPGAADKQLFETIKRMDGVLFDAFNAHQPDVLMTYFTDDLEFYQDNDGLKSFQESLADFRKLFTSAPDIRRELVAGSLEVYPIKDFGAMEIGDHRFCHKENGKEECGIFKFAMVWKKVGDSWKISRVLSYDHKPHQP